MRQVTHIELREIMLCNTDLAIRYTTPINRTMQRYKINTFDRATMWLAQVGHESGGLVYKEEIASGADYDVGAKAAALGNTPARDGDGEKFKGRGLIQLTGTDNYLAYAKFVNMTLSQVTAWLKTDAGSADVAGWFWSEFYNLNGVADWGRGSIESFEQITKFINGGLNGWPDRLAYLDRAKAVLAWMKN